MIMMCTEDTTVLVDEVLHSIFFLGKIKMPIFSPADIVSDDPHLINTLREPHPGPFDHYSSQVPRRSPFSCVLDMVVNVTGQNNEGEIRQWLQTFVGRLRGDINKPLVSKTICVSQSNPPGSVRFYGVSMSADGAVPKKILIGASCLSSWDEYVADAVMTYYPEPNRRPFVRKTYFDGTIRVPENVRCETFDLYDGGLKPPCKSCGELFGLTTTETRGFAHGNCAEAESLSNLFQGDEAVREQARPTSVTYTEQNRERARNSVLEALRGLVRAFEGFTQWTHVDSFYIPQ
ncbi:uncharacterized protein LOC116060813 [Sander lucioperca]|uniref:uncharacterized protein LOC116060813 n=1 Tax=Sander lucioperca TaxID=283035 RepID=UPI0016539DED|nr:uncharacterized protein LOC116060813 [Sander lucioperca]